ncbi:amidohydrolase family protein [Novosphingobium sp. FKTRR1]|uniref:amidohydrolase family protein n=1 Tax=Novosphingobium sp. FKTRR1 TaxID=2879118 RepID=UPI001CF07D6B|nr:amidohydrolase family protein [Novosphingobium sp. FKTRR1]
MSQTTRARAAFALILATSTALGACPALAASEHFSVISGNKIVGHLDVETTGKAVTIDFDIKDNGRGPTMKEALTLGSDGLPVTWAIDGATTFGSKVAERFALKGGKATWTDAAGKGSATVKAPTLYVTQNGSPWEFGLQVRALLAAPGQTLPALPGGALRLTKGDVLTVNGADGPLEVTQYAISGTNYAPAYALLDKDGALFAQIDPSSVVVRKGYEGEQVQLRGLAADLQSRRYADLQARYAHNFGAPVRITNVRLFDPVAKALTGPVQVLVNGNRITAVEPADSPATPGEATIDGAGGTLVAGMTDMHGHIGQDDALLNVLAGVTSVRDMGNDNAVLDDLISRIEKGVITGPRVIRSGFIEGKSPFNANNGFVVDSEAKAIDAVRWYAARGYWQVKIYNSMNPAWVPAVVAEAHRLGLRVAGHVPAFTNADAMIAAGYDEMTHINQVSLGWVIKQGEDTRTLFRLYGLKRLATLDLASAPVQATIATMAQKHIAIDPTLGIHENLLLNRDGTVAPGAVDYVDHLPVAEQRAKRQQWIDTSAPGDEAAYRAAYGKLIAITKQMHDAGIFIVPGTDTGGSFTYHRELELYEAAGFSSAEILARATLDVQRYMGRDQELGSIAKGKLADFFLIPGDPVKDLKAIKTIRMVVKNGTFYFPTEIYPELGVKPFTTTPAITLPAPVAKQANAGGASTLRHDAGELLGL